MVPKLQLMTQELLENLKEDWQFQLESLDINPARFLGAIARAAAFVAGDYDKNQYAYAFIQNEKVDALLLLSHACPQSDRSWLKVLEITLSPTLVDNEAPVSADTLIKMFAHIVMDVAEMTDNEHPSNKIKIYSDSIMDIRMLTALAENLQDEDFIPFHSSSHRGWLILEKKGRVV